MVPTGTKMILSQVHSKTLLARSEYVCLPSHSKMEARRYSIQAPASLHQKQQWMGRICCFLGCVSPVGT